MYKQPFLIAWLYFLARGGLEGVAPAGPDWTGLAKLSKSACLSTRVFVRRSDDFYIIEVSEDTMPIMDSVIWV